MSANGRSPIQDAAMNESEQQWFYEEARFARNMDRETVDMVIDVARLDINTASALSCKQAVIKWQYMSDENPWEWATNHSGLQAAWREWRDRG